MATIAAHLSRPTAETARPKLLKFALLVAAAVALGLTVGSIPRIPAWIWLAAVPALLLFMFFVGLGARVCLAALLVTDLVGLYQESVNAGGFGLRIIDVAWLGLVGWAIATRVRGQGRRGAPIGQLALGLWLVALGVSLYPIAAQALGDVSDPLIAWFRLVQTFTLVWLVPYAIRNVVDLEYVIGAIEVAAAAEMVSAIVGAGSLSQRLEGDNGPNPTGLIAAVLVVSALHAPVPRRRSWRIAMFVLGIAGLLLSRSLGATAAVAAALGIFGLRSSSAARASGARTGLVTPVRVLLLVVAAVTVAASFRPENLPSSSKFSQSTTVHRAILGYAGLELFATRPLTGVGWQRAPVVIGSPEISNELARRFGSQYKSDFSTATNPTSVHNAYIEIAAEAGLLGIFAFLALLVCAWRGISRVLRSVRDDPRVFASAKLALVLLVVILFWWNDNALFGAQPETVLAATLLGILASAPLVMARDDARVNQPARIPSPAPTPR